MAPKAVQARATPTHQAGAQHQHQLQGRRGMRHHGHAQAIQQAAAENQAPRAMALGDPAGQRLGDAPHQVLQRQRDAGVGAASIASTPDGGKRPFFRPAMRGAHDAIHAPGTP
ncbi:hypothetical protein [Massilia sp. HP4]|uniref:hypothetical protein n=1 Tax=Massilia sp. HP4 TaxID=2562316 RepID=UPI0010C0D613|nr:hypothetical protein [Massilia sp. HP4]